MIALCYGGLAGVLTVLTEVLSPLQSRKLELTLNPTSESLKPKPPNPASHEARGMAVIGLTSASWTAIPSPSSLRFKAL